MGKASISIAITSNFSSKGIDAAIRKMEQLNAQAISLHGQFGKSAIDAGAMLGQFGARLQTIGQQISDFGDKLTMGITLPVGVAATATTIAAAQIDTAWYNVRKTVDMTEEGYERLKQGAIALSDIQPVSAETILNIESLGGQLGIATDYLEEFARVMSGLEIATNMTWEEASQNTAKFRNIVQMSEDDIDNFASTIVDLGNHTATTEKDILNLATKFASAGHVAGMSNQDILGLSAALSGLGMKAEAGGSALSQVINKISLAVSEGGEDVQGWADLVGKSVEDFSAAWREAPTEEFVEILKAIGADGADANKILSDLEITQIRQSDAMRRLASSGDLVTNSIERANSAWSENTALTREVENRNESIAARFETIWNRITNTAASFGEPIAEILISALDSLEPFLDWLRDLAQAFADADPVTKRFTTNLTGIAVAAGPVLSVFGRLTSGFGSFLTWIGRITQQWGRFKEALKTTDAAMLQTLSTEDTWAVKLGLSHNAIIKNVGGLERYKSVVVPYVSQVRKQAEATERTTIAEEARIKVEKLGYTSKRKITTETNKIIRSEESRARVTEAGNKAVDKLTQADLEAAAANETVGKSSKAAGTAAEEASVGVTAFCSAMRGIAAIGLIGVGISAFTYITTQAQVAKERTEALEKATRRLSDTYGQSGSSARNAAENTEELNQSYGRSIEAVDKAIEKQGELVETIDEIMSSAELETATLDEAWQVIEEYANQSDLSASKQYKLKQAIEKVNEICGTQYEVVDASQGKIQDETGEILNNTDAIKDNIEQRKKLIEIQAYENAYQEALEAQIETTKAYKDAQDDLNEARQTYANLSKKIERGETLSKEEYAQYRELADILPELESAEKRAGEAEEAAGDNAAYLREQYEKLVGTIDTAVGSIEEYVEAFSKDIDLSTAFGDKVDQVASQFHDLGIHIDASRQISLEAANAISNAYDGTATSIVKSLQSMEETRWIAENIGRDWYNSFDESTRQVVDSVRGMTEYTNADLRAMAIDFGYTSTDAAQRFVTNLKAGLDAGLESGTAIYYARKFTDGFSEGLDPATAQAAVEAYMKAIKDGLSEEKAREAAQQIIDGLQNSLNGANFDGTQAGMNLAYSLQTGVQSSMAGVTPIMSDTGRVVGYALADGTRIGIEEGGDGVPTAIQNMVDGGKEPLVSLIPLAYNNGLLVGPNYAQGISDGGGEVHPAANGLWGAVVSDLQQGVPGAEGAGNETGAGYSGEIAAQEDPAVRAAKNTQIGVIQAYILGIIAAKVAGETIGARFAGGISSKTDSARNAAKLVANAAAHSFSSGSQYAYNSGANLGSNFAAGIASASARIAAAASNAAAAASRFLHHSTPEAGPLKDDDVWGYHFAQNLADGMRKGTPLIARQASAIASSMALDGQQIASSTSRAVISRYGASQAQWKGYQTRGQIAAQAQAQAQGATTPYLTRDDVREAVAEAIAEAVPPEFAMYLNGSKLASSIAGDMDYELGQLDARR